MRLTHDNILNLPGIGVAVCLVLAACVETHAQVPALYKDTNRRGALAAKSDDPSVVRSKNIIVDVRQLRNQQRRRISMPIFGKQSIILSRLSLEEQKSGLVWKGIIANQQGTSATFVIVGDVVIGNILTRTGNMYQIRYLGNGVHTLREVDRSKFPPEGESSAPPADAVQVGKSGELLAAASARPTCATDPATEIDVLVLFTATTRAAAGGVAAIQATALLAIQETNDSYNNSGITQRVRLAHMEEVSYPETGNSRTDVNRLRNATDGFIDNAHALRDTFAADAVMLVVETLVKKCGEAFDILDPVSNAFEKSAFAVVARDCATGNFSFGHELGHLM